MMRCFPPPTVIFVDIKNLPTPLRNRHPKVLERESKTLYINMAKSGGSSSKGSSSKLQKGEIQRQKSPAEFFADNQAIAGFDNYGKSLYTSIRELMENSLVSCVMIIEGVSQLLALGYHSGFVLFLICSVSRVLGCL